MPAGPTLDEIMNAIHASGYLMEQEVASELERLDFHVKTNFAFEDIDEGKSRELDARAIRRVAVNEEQKAAAFIELLVECKNNSNPLAFITRPKNEIDNRAIPQEFLFPYAYEMKKDLGGGRGLSRTIPAYSHLGFDKVDSEFGNPMKAVQFCQIDRKGKGWQASHGHLYDGLFYPMVKAFLMRKEEYATLQRNGDWVYFWLYFPIIVTHGGLFLVDSTKETPTPESIPFVSFVRELKSGKIEGDFKVTFVQQNSIEGFLKSVVDPFAEQASILINERADFIKNRRIPWRD